MNTVDGSTINKGGLRLDFLTAYFIEQPLMVLTTDSLTVNHYSCWFVLY